MLRNENESLCEAEEIASTDGYSIIGASTFRYKALVTIPTMSRVDAQKARQSRRRSRSNSVAKTPGFSLFGAPREITTSALLALAFQWLRPNRRVLQN